MSVKVMALGFGLVVIGLLAPATGVKWWEVRRAASWRTAPGRITRSRAVTRKLRGLDSHDRARADQDLETRNFADIGYEYRVGGRRLTGKRVSIGEDLGDWQVAETLARYPEGAPVLVHYDPARPSEAVLERDAPEGVFRTLGTLITVLAVGLIAAAIGLPRLETALATHLADPARALPVLILAGMALAAALATWAIGRQAAVARDWPWVEGEILAAGVEEVAIWRDREAGVGSRILHRAAILYRYRVGGVDLVGTRAHFGPRIHASLPALARAFAPGHRKGDRVAVRYNPKNSAESVLDPRAPGLWLGWVAAAGLCALAMLVVL
ncbi:DUF3592 domain-containing protein [Albidovulum sp.]|uniref:DUF3592 domain-containing protein n=1 Tax=Albidovulum sp. TaxID=1872424 RepID=UPI0039B94059